MDRLGRAGSSSIRQVARAAALACLPSNLMLESRPAHLPPMPSFDDGPDPQLTPRLLDLLGNAGVRAWFFVVGQRAVQHPAIARRIVAEGHLIGNHSWSHPAPRTLGPRAYMQDVGRARDALEQLLGVPVTDFRPPHGHLTARTTITLWRSGQRIVLWNVDPKDYAVPAASDIATSLERLAPRHGDLVLLHDTHPPTLTALEGGAIRLFAPGTSP